MRVILAAILVIAALVLVVGPAGADCPDGQDCPLEAPQSREVSRAPEPAADLAAIPDPAGVVPMPLPARMEVGLGGEVGAIPAIERLRVPLLRQGAEEVTCGAYALAMALSGLPGAPPSAEAILEHLRAQGWLYEFGTGVEELAATAAHFGYAGTLPFHDGSLDELQAELAAGRPVVVALGLNGEGQPGHFVTLTGISEDGAWVSYHDPAQGELVLSVGEFLRLWNEQGYAGVKVGLEAQAAGQGSASLTPWLTLAAGLMALISQTPLVRRRRGIGGALAATESGTGGPPPYPAPAGYRWVMGSEPVYGWKQVTVTEVRQVPNIVKVWGVVREKRWVERVPVYRTVRVDRGSWRWRRVVRYRTQRYRTTERYRVARTYWTRRGGRWVRGVRYEYRTRLVWKTRRVPYTTWERTWQPKMVTEKRLVGYREVERSEPIYGWVEQQQGTKKVVTKRIVPKWMPLGSRLAWKLEREPLLPSPTAEELQDELEDLKAGRQPLEEGQDPLAARPDPMQMWTAAPLNLRQAPGDGAVLWKIPEGAQVRWTGEVQVVGSTAWRQVQYQDLYDRKLTGWVSAQYLVSQLPRLSQPRQLNPLELRLQQGRYDWYHLMSEAERAEYLARVEALREQLRDWLARNGDDLADTWQAGAELPRSGIPRGADAYEHERVLEALEALLGIVVSLDGMPGSFTGPEDLVSPQMQAVYDALMSLPEDGSGTGQRVVWDALAGIVGASSPDLILTALGRAPVEVTEGGSVGDFPLRLWVSDPAGARLRQFPHPDGPPVEGTRFQGIPYYSQDGAYNTYVTWNGRYHVAVDSQGKRHVYYYVSYTWKPTGQVYEGWVDSAYFSPKMVSPGVSRRVSGDGPVQTFGYGAGAAGWQRYHTYGAAQYLNLRKLFQAIGDPDYDKYPVRHKNLCGELAVMEAVGVSLEEGFRRFRDVGPSHATILRNAEMGTAPSPLRDFFNAFSDYGWHGEQASSNAKDARDRILRGEKVLALVTIDTAKGGRVSMSGPTLHWVGLRSLSEETNRVVYYNPYTNGVETVAMAEFMCAWEKASGGAKLIVAGYR